MPITCHETSDLSFDYACSNRSLPFAPHIHGTWEMLFVISGDLTYIVNDRIYTASNGSLLIARPSVIHSISFNSGATYKRYAIYFNEKYMPEKLLSQIPVGVDVLDFSDDDVVASLFSKLIHYKKNFQPEIYRLLLQSTVEEILYNITNKIQILLNNRSQKKPPAITRAIDYINAHITENLNIDMIASELFITRSHLHHIFVKHLNTTPKKYITAQRLLLAQRDLRLRYKPIEVSARYGFSDYSTFYRDYKTFFGYPPSKESSVPLCHDIDV